MARVSVGNLFIKNYISDVSKFTKRCQEMWIPPMQKSLYERHGDKTLDFINSFIEQYSVNTDPETNEQLKFASECFVGYYTNKMCPEYTPYLKKHIKKFGEEKGQIRQKYNFINPITMEVFHFVHGLRFTHPEIQQYVRNRDIMDVGAFIGDSALILSDYTDKTIYSYELSPKLTKTIKANLQKGGKEDRVFLQNLGVDKKKYTMQINDVANAGGSIGMKGKVEVNVTTIDDEVEKHGIIPGFIKADVEGFGLNVIKGADKTIRKYRPVIEIACYHSYDEMYILPEYMRQYPNYIFVFHPENELYLSMAEIAFFAYPAELLYPVGILDKIN